MKVERDEMRRGERQTFCFEMRVERKHLRALFQRQDMEVREGEGKVQKKQKNMEV